MTDPPAELAPTLPIFDGEVVEGPCRAVWPYGRLRTDSGMVLVGGVVDPAVVEQIRARIERGGWPLLGRWRW